MKNLPQQQEMESWMREALQLARDSAERDEVPIGAVVISENQIIGRSGERKIELSDPTAHAELLAIREAARFMGDWRLENCILVATLEPCPMCVGAALLSRIPLLVYGARNLKFGAVETHLPMLDYPKWNHTVHTVKGVMAEECADLLSAFFARKRLG
jgi:tRNA(adenine34) deaminase